MTLKNDWSSHVSSNKKCWYTCSISVFSFIQGEVFAKGTISYEKRRLIHNGLCTHIYPDWIVVPESTEDVAAIVKITNRLETIQDLNFRIGIQFRCYTEFTDIIQCGLMIQGFFLDQKLLYKTLIKKYYFSYL